MNRNLILAILLSSAIYIVWFTYVSPPPKTDPAKTELAQKENIKTEKTNQGKTADFSAKKEILSQDVLPLALKTEKATFLINPKTTDISDVVIRGPVNEINFALTSQSAFLKTLDNVDWKIIKKTDSSVLFFGKLSSDIAVKKTISLSQNNGLNDLKLEFENISSVKYSVPSFYMDMGPGLGTVASENKENPKVCEASYTYQEPNKKNPTIAKIKDKTEKENFIWAGLNNRYFLFAAVNSGDLISAKNEKRKIGEHDFPYLQIEIKGFSLNPGTKKEINIPFYSGPKDLALLKKLGNGLDRSVDFGFFSPLAKIADSALHYFHSKTGNYGIAIILLSIAIQLVLFPLSMKSYKAMAVMKKLQPEMQSIQQRYKDDPKRMNTELMELYKKYGANPLSGCWPMLLQMPIFFALFTALRNSWNLHGAHFGLWIKDLSDKDPYYVLPIFMGALMFLQQSFSPQMGGDPTQNKIMKWMPVIFTFVFLSFPSGLVIYWIINSVFSIGQTLYLKSKEAK